MNTISIMGRITADPELKHTQNNIAVCAFTVAVPRPHTKDTTDFIRCVAWRGAAEFVSKYFSKGKMIAITGILTVRSWKDEEEKTHSVNEVIAENISFCGDKTTGATNEIPANDIPDGFMQVTDDIPF